MKVKQFIATAGMIAGFVGAAGAESRLAPLNEAGYGTFSAQMKSVSMYRDFENANPGNAWSSTLGVGLGYESPDIAGFSAGASYLYAEPVGASDDSQNGKLLLSNGRVNLFNEAWVKYTFEDICLSNTWVKAGRQVVNGEVFRADNYRQKPRSLEAVVISTKDIPNMVLTVGHAWRLSNWIDNNEAWKFNDISDTLGAGYSTRGVTWGETVYTGITNLEVAAYDAYAHDIANIAGGRALYSLTDETAVGGYYRHESDVGKGADRSSDMTGLSLCQKVGDVTLEPGYLSVHGDNLLFQELTTGLNHPLGASMIIYPGMFNGGSETGYLKATAKVGKTALYALYNYTWQDHSRNAYDGQELNVVVSRPLCDSLSVAVKVGAGYRDGKNGAEDTTATDTRLFVTYTF